MPAEGFVVLRAQFRSRHIAQPQQRTVGLGAQDDVAELFGLEQPACGVDRVLEIGAMRDRRLANGAGRILAILGLNGV